MNNSLAPAASYAYLAGHISIEQDGEAADERLGDRSGSSFGHDRVARMHVLVYVVDETRHGHRHPARVSLGSKRLEQLLVPSADDNDLAAASQLLCNLVNGDLKLPHALTSAHQKDSGEIRGKTESLFHGLLGWKWL